MKIQVIISKSGNYECRMVQVDKELTYWKVSIHPQQSIFVESLTLHISIPYVIDDLTENTKSWINGLEQ